VIDHLHGDAPSLRPGKRDGGVAVEGFPGFLIDLGLEGGFEALVGVVLAEEVGTPEKVRSTAAQLVSVIESR